ncbi:MAG: ABC transporter ATP-binding protein [Halobacteriales archaeon]
MIELEGVVRDYGDFRLGPIDLTVGDEVLSVLGPSGCGKTTVLSLIAGIATPDAGSIRLHGEDVTDRPPEERGTALVFQGGALFPHMTARENVAYAVDGEPDAVEERVTAVAELLEIEDVLDRNVTGLSGGERQRVALARALAADPDALLLDEPLANLDAPVKRRLGFELRDLFEDLDVPVIYVTHDQQRATTIADRLAVMRDGRIEQAGDPEAIFERPRSTFVAEFTGGTNVFEADVWERSDHGLVLSWHGERIETPPADVDGADRVTFGIRPEYVTILREGRPATDRHNVFAADVESRIYQGDEYVLTVRPDAVPEPVEIRLPTPVYERLSLADRERVRISLKKGAIHVLE